MLARPISLLARQLKNAWRPLSGAAQQTTLDVDALASSAGADMPAAALPQEAADAVAAAQPDPAPETAGSPLRMSSSMPETATPAAAAEAALPAAVSSSSTVGAQGPIVMTRLNLSEPSLAAPRPGGAPAAPVRPQQPPLQQQQPLMGLRMEDPSLPLPRFTPPQRKTRPAPIDVLAGIETAKAEANARFTESLEVAFNLGTDPRRGDQAVRGAATLPHGTGKSVRIGVFATDEAAAMARAAGAEVVGGEELVAEILRGGGSAIPFDKCLATADMMPKLARIARILGPRGLMPNPKLGTIVAPGGLREAVATLKAGRVEYRADRTGVLHAAFGKCSFPTEHLYANLGVLTAAVLGSRPKGLKGGGMTGYILRATLSSTMGRAVPVTLPSLQQAVVAAAAKRPLSI